MKYLATLFVVLLTGCAYVHSTTYSYDGSGKQTGKTTATAYAMFDSNSQMTKFHNQSDKSGSTNGFSYSPGTTIGSVNENASSTNAVAILQAIQGILQHLP